MKGNWVWAIALVFTAIGLSSCNGIGDNSTEMMQLYNKVYTGVFWWMFIVGILASIGFGFILGAKSNSGGIAGTIIALGILLHGCIGYVYSAPNAAEHATTVAWEAARDEQARYRQKIHGYWVAYDEIRHDCRYSSFSKSSTGCVYVTESCSTDKDGNRDCDYTPWFAYERTLTGVINDNWRNPTITFATHLAPADWRNNQFSRWGSIPWGKQAGRDFLYEDHPDWSRVKQAIDSGHVMPGSYYNDYHNWMHANDRSLHIQYGGHIETYRAKGLLPVINPIYDTFDYDVVQFSPGVVVNTEQRANWQRIAHLWAGQAGQRVQASLILFFALESEVTDTYQWINTSKSYLQQESFFGRDILPKNMVLVNCVIDDAQTTIMACRLETGMFEGNNRLKLQTADVGGVAFTPEAVFGYITASFTRDGTFVLDENGWRVLEVSIEGGEIGNLILTGFERVRMTEKEYLRTSIQPTTAQQRAIYVNAIWNLLKSLGTIYFLLLVGLVQLSATKK